MDVLSSDSTVGEGCGSRGDAGQAKPHLGHNPLSLLGTWHATPIRKLNDPACDRLHLYRSVSSGYTGIGARQEPSIRAQSSPERTTRMGREERPCVTDWTSP